MNEKDKYEPKPEDYVEWDGKYFYYANFRCSTDLTIEEAYLTEIIYNEKVYAVDEVNHWAFKDNKLHMTFCIEVASETLSSEVERLSAYTIYSLEKKEVEYLYIYDRAESSYEIDLNKILDIEDNYTIISGTGKITKIDIALNEIETIYCDSYEVKNDYAVIKYNNELFASSIEEFKFKKIMDLSNVSSYFDYYIHNVNDKPFLQIIDHSSSFVNGQYINTNSLTYYDFKNETFYELVKFEDNKFLSLDSNTPNMFILGEPKLKEYNPYTPDDQHLEYKLFVDNNILYTVTFNEYSGVKLKELYVFNQNEEYSILHFENNIIHLNKRRLSKPGNFKYFNKINITTKYFDIVELRILNEEEHDYTNRIVLAEDSNIIYYIETKIKPAFMAEDTIYYYLYRYDTKTQEKGLLKYFVDNLGDSMFNNYLINKEKYDFDILVMTP